MDERAAATATGWRRHVPAAVWLPRYRRGLLPGDLLAGAVVTALAVPQALGYASIAGVPVQVGLYAIPLALLAYAVLGSSPHLIVGPVSTVSVLSGSLVADLAKGDQAKAPALTSALAIAAGVILVAAGLAGIGWAAEFLSRPIVTGFVFGLCMLIIIGEVPSLLGMPVESGDALHRAWSVATHLTDANPTTSLVGLTALAVLFAGSRFAPRVPWGLLVLLAGIGLSSALGLAARGVATVGSVPKGLPPLGLPAIGVADVPQVMLGGGALALVAIAEGLSAARLFAMREGYTVHTNQELVATGAANIGAGLSGGLGVAGSLSKTAASRRAGGSTQITGVVTALLTLVVIALFAETLSPLPRAVLSAIVIQAVWGLMDVGAIRRYQTIRRNDFVAAVAAMGGVLVLGPLYGLLFAVGMALLGLIYRSSRVDLDVMGKVPGEKAAWGSISRHPERRTYDGIAVLRLDVPLFWANATEIHDRVLEVVESDLTITVVMLDLEATSQIDTTSIDVLADLIDRLRAKDIDLYLVRVFFRARQTLAAAGLIGRIGEDHMWHSISAGTRAAREHHGLTAKPHPQGAPAGADEADDEDPWPGNERIAAEHEEGGYTDDPPPRR